MNVKHVQSIPIVKHKTNKNIILNIIFRLYFSLNYYNVPSDHSVKKLA
jgi:hypothetical protein